MIDQYLKNEVLLRLNTEVKHQEDFLDYMKKINCNLDNEGSPPLYFLQELIKMCEQYIISIQKTVTQVPLEDEPE